MVLKPINVCEIMGDSGGDARCEEHVAVGWRHGTHLCTGWQAADATRVQSYLAACTGRHG